MVLFGFEVRMSKVEMEIKYGVCMWYAYMSNGKNVGNKYTK